VVAAAGIVFQDNAIGGRSANCGHLTATQANNVAPRGVSPREQESHIVSVIGEGQFVTGHCRCGNSIWWN
jgi:hypothetical protein